jgi:hypothetical protein
MNLLKYGGWSTMDRSQKSVLLACCVALVGGIQSGTAQEATPINAPQIATSSQSTPQGAAAGVRNEQLTLPKDAGQHWMEYDLRPYSRLMPGVDRPQQAVLDWILRDTGTDVWFHEPCGVLTADRSTLRVYHNDAMQKTVQQTYEKFVNGPSQTQSFGLKIFLIANPNWRQRSLAWMKSVDVQSPGVSGWLLSKENAVLFAAMLRSRNDAVETTLPTLNLINGQSVSIDQLRTKTYVREFQKQESPYPSYIPVNDQLQEGYRIQFSPLLSTDLRTLEVSLKASIDQVERLNNVMIELPSPAVPATLTAPASVNAQIQVPQLASWRLQERFKWPSDQVLVLSCGVIASPTHTNLQNTLLGNAPAPTAGFLGLNRLLPSQGGARSDALLFLEYKGTTPSEAVQGMASSTIVPSSQNVSSSPADATPSVANTPQTSSSISRGRY